MNAAGLLPSTPKERVDTMSQHYILDNRKVVPADLMTWATWFESNDNRRVDSTHIGETHISTVFIGRGHAFCGDGPKLFETMVFGGPLDQEQERCGTYEEAEAMHAAMCERVRTAP
jgi:hypothetical protein